MDHRSEVVETLLQNRCLLLPLFRRVFAYEPDAAFVAVLAGDEATGALDLVATDENDLASLAGFLRALPTGDGTGAFVDAARTEYTKLFIGPQKALAPFWESVYLDPRELLFLASTADVKRRYEARAFA
nr:molecular chaperone TorD family protein [Eggerthella sinensis]